MFKKAIAIILIIVIGFTVYSIARNPSTKSLKEGDIVFQISKSKQSPYIIFATESPWSHCGVIVEKDDRLFVLEAVSTVKLTPYERWAKRGRWGKVVVKRQTNEPIKLRYSKYLGKPYDTAFKFDNNKWYCSELVYDIYKTQFGVELCQPRKVHEYNLKNLDSILKKRGIDQNQLVVAPSDLYNSVFLH